MQHLNLVFLLLVLVCNSENYRILGIFPVPGKSHMNMCERIMKSLAAKGHEVDVVSHFPLTKTVPRYNDISIRGMLPLYENTYSIELLERILRNPYTTAKTTLLAAGSHYCTVLFNSTVGRELRSTNITYDLIVTHLIGSHCMFGFAHYFQVPVVTIITSSSIPWGSNRYGNPDNPAYILNYFLTQANPLDFLDRLTNTATSLLTKLTYHFASKFVTDDARKFFGPELPNIEDLSYNTNLVLWNSHFSINVQPAVPHLIEVGGSHIKSVKPLPKHLQNSVTNTSQYKGVIYLSMGSMIVTETFAPQKLQALFDAFGELPYKVLWKAALQNISQDLNIPSNIQFEPWLPQFDQLCHPNTKLFVTHGGLFGTQESMYCGIPRLGIPFCADQETNIKTAISKGLAIMVKYDNITKENILNAARTLLQDPQYKINAEIASNLFKDRPFSAIDITIYWIEYIIRHKGGKHLRSDVMSLTWYEYVLIDVLFILIAFVSVFIPLTYYVSKYFVRTFYSN